MNRYLVTWNLLMIVWCVYSVWDIWIRNKTLYISLGRLYIVIGKGIG